MARFLFRLIASEDFPMIATGATLEGFEISPRFRETIVARIARLERDADQDEARLPLLSDSDHIRRHMRLVALQRTEALRMRKFLNRCRPRQPNPLTAP
jgi:hypothetical protein